VRARIAAKAGLEISASDAPTTDARLEELLRLVGDAHAAGPDPIRAK